jgi:hypothetical protein
MSCNSFEGIICVCIMSVFYESKKFSGNNMLKWVEFLILYSFSLPRSRRISLGISREIVEETKNVVIPRNVRNTISNVAVIFVRRNCKYWKLEIV